MTITVEASGTLFNQRGTSGTVTTGTVTVPGGLSNPAVVVFVGYETGADVKSVDTVDYDGGSMGTALVQQILGASNANIPDLECFAKLTGVTAGTFDVDVNWVSGTSDDTQMGMYLVLDAPNPILSSAVNNASALLPASSSTSIGLTTVNNDAFVAVGVCPATTGGHPLSSLSNWTQQVGAVTSGPADAGMALAVGGGTVTTAGATTFGWTTGPNTVGSRRCASVVVEFYESAPSTPEITTNLSSYTADGQSITVTASPAFPGTINSATINGHSVTVSGASTSGCTLTGPGLSDFFGGTFADTRWDTNVAVEVGDGSQTASVNVQFTAPEPAGFGTAGAGPYEYDLDA